MHYTLAIFGSFGFRLGYDAMLKLQELVPLIGTAVGSTMRRVLRMNAAPRALNCSLAFTISLLTAAIALPDSDRLLEKGHSDAKPDTAPANTMPPARDSKLAVEEEYQMARRLNTVQSLELFIARHPDSPLAARARADLRLLSR